MSYSKGVNESAWIRMELYSANSWNLFFVTNHLQPVITDAFVEDSFASVIQTRYTGRGLVTGRALVSEFRVTVNEENVPIDGVWSTDLGQYPM